MKRRNYAFFKIILVAYTIFSILRTHAAPSISGNSGTFPLKSDIKTRHTLGERKAIKVSGYIGGASYSGTGMYLLEPAVATTVNENPAFSNREIFIATVENKQYNSTVQLSFDYLLYFDPNFTFIGEICQNHEAEDEELRYGVYTVFERTIPSPEQIRAHDFGELSSAIVYRDKTKKETIGKVTRSYIVEPDTETSVIMRISERHFRNDGGLLARVEGRYKIDSSGKDTLISWEVYRKNRDFRYEVAQ